MFFHFQYLPLKQLLWAFYSLIKKKTFLGLNLILFAFKGAFNNNVYYKHETTKILPAGERKIQTRKILALSVNKKGIIINKKVLNLDDGEEFNPASGKTETAGSDFTFFQQVFSNLRSGRFASTD